MGDLSLGVPDSSSSALWLEEACRTLSGRQSTIVTLAWLGLPRQICRGVAKGGGYRRPTLSYAVSWMR
jgi:hypothetical protein